MRAEETAQKLADCLISKLAQLDEIGAQIAAAYVDSAINALCRQFNLASDSSEPE